ncbi:MAG TPA: NifB/NifX family molybdenum-iron cluster-binding protein [Sedimentisphaerales bacterium]|nr:NifB/NifX family molybdenum-iron cluster-binding protein [Sedimentisphaerales bacterium]
MRICIPVQTNEGLRALVNHHFGSSPYFLIYDSDKEVFEVISNSDEHHSHGMCHPLKVLDDQNLDAVVCVGMGARAVQKLRQGGLKAYRTKAETAEETIREYKEGGLEEITIENACIDHSCH